MPSILKPLAAALIFFAFLYVTAVKNVDPDLGWHLTVGEQILADRAVPRADIYSYTMPGHEWVDHEWLQEAGLAFLNRSGLFAVAQFLFALLAFLPFAVWVWRSRSVLELGFTLLGAVLMTGFIGVRPQVVSFALFFVAFELIEKLFSGQSFRKIPAGVYPAAGGAGMTVSDVDSRSQSGMTGEKAGRNGKKELWASFGLIVLFFAWANLHAGFAAGLALFGIYLAVEFGSNVIYPFCHPRPRPDRGAGSTRESRTPPASPSLGEGERGGVSEDAEMTIMSSARPWVSNRAMLRLLVFLASVLVTFLNPYGAALHREILAVLSSPYVSQYILEWQNAFNFPSVSGSLLLGATFFFAVRFRRSYPAALLVAVGFFLLSYLKAVRMAPQFLTLALPVIWAGIAETRALAAESWRAHPPAPRLIRAVQIAREAFLLLATLAVLAAAARYPDPQLPAQAVEFLRNERAAGRKITLINDYGWGGYLIRNAPELKVFIDGRMPHWVDAQGVSAMKDYVTLSYESDTAERDAVLGRWGITAVLTENRAAEAAGFAARIVHQIPAPIRERLGTNPFVIRLNQLLSGRERGERLDEYLRRIGWQVAYEDTIAVVLTRP